MIKARVITCSDAASRGEREDRSGPAVRELLATNGYDVDSVVVVPDDVDAIATAIENATGDGARLVVTTGGTGIAPRDVTPEATMQRLRARRPRLRRADAAALARENADGAALARAGRRARLGIDRELTRQRERRRRQPLRDPHLVPHALELLAGARVEHRS